MKTDIVDLVCDKLLHFQEDGCILFQLSLDEINMLDTCVDLSISDVIREDLRIL
jgi:hypothetical protein